MGRSPLSFLVVQAVEAGRSLTLRDLFTNQTHVVRETSASRSIEVGHAIFGRVLTLDSVAILVGTGAYGLPARTRIRLIEARDALAGEGAFLTPEDLLGREREVRGLYLQLVDRILRPEPPTLTNTDGEPFVLCRVTFDLDCPPRAGLHGPQGPGSGRERR